MADKTVYVQPVGDDTGDHYHTLAAAIAGELIDNANLTTMDGNLYIIIRSIGAVTWSGAPDTTIVEVQGFTTSAGHEVYIQTDAANRFDGVWDTSKYILRSTTGQVALDIKDNYVTCNGLQIEQINTGAWACGVAIGTGASGDNKVVISNSCIKVTGDTGQIHIGLYVDPSYSVINVWNTVVWITGAGGAGSHGMELFVVSAVLENCTVYGGDRGYMNRSNGSAFAINCLGFNTGGVAFYDYSWASGTTNNASDDATAPGDNQHDNVTVSLVDPANGDFRVKSTDTDIIGHGTASVTLGFTDDANGVIRGVAWDIGALEYAISVPVVNNVGEKEILARALGIHVPGDGDTLSLRLFKNNVTVSEGDTWRTFTESTGTGYAAIKLAGANWVI
jgi:hypothetical protein